MRIAAFAILLAFVAGCKRATGGGVPVSSRRATDSTIYAQLLDSLRGSGDSVFVRREFNVSSDSASAVPSLAGWVHKELPTIDSALVVALDTSRYAGNVEAILGPVRGVHWFSDLQKLRERGLFRTHRFVSFSRIVYDASRTHALVFATMTCGGLCGDGSYYAFELRNGRWNEVGTVMRFVS